VQGHERYSIFLVATIDPENPELPDVLENTLIILPAIKRYSFAHLTPSFKEVVEKTLATVPKDVLNSAAATQKNSPRSRAVFLKQAILFFRRNI
jgi:hypothetical protein